MKTTVAKRLSAGLLFAAGLGVLVSACERREDKRALGAERTGSLKAASESIAQGRCEREMRCNNVGAGKKFETKDACVSKLRKENQDDLNPKDCPGGIDQKALQDCMKSIRTDDCNNPFDELGRMTACRKGELCRRRP